MNNTSKKVSFDIGKNYNNQGDQNDCHIDQIPTKPDSSEMNLGDSCSKLLESEIDKLDLDGQQLKSPETINDIIENNID